MKLTHPLLTRFSNKSLVAVHEKKIGLFGGTDVKEVIMLNASTGVHQKISIEDVPK